MNARKTLAKVIERMYPEKVERIKAERIAKRTAMQAMLDADRTIRANGCNVERTNLRMADALRQYELGNFGTARSWAEMEARKPSWAVSV